MKLIQGIIWSLGFIVRTMRTLAENIEAAWYEKRHMAFGLNIISTVLFIGLILLVIYSLYGFFAFLGMLWEKGEGFFSILLFALIIAAPDLCDKFFSQKPPAEPVTSQNDESRDKANKTYETVVHPNMRTVFEEASKYYPIYPPTRSSILPPNGAIEALTDKGSHWVYEVRAKLKQDVTDEEVGKIEKGLQDIIEQKLTVHELSNLDTEWVQDARGVSYPKLMIDSVLVAQDNLLVYVAIASVNYFNYKLANPRRGQGHNQLFDDFFKNV